MATKHLLKFQTEADYKTAKKNHLVLPNVSSVEETGNVYINGRFTTKEKAEAGTIIAYHEHTGGEKEIKYIVPEAFDKTDPYWKADAIVVVPYSHTGDGTVRAMALNYASVDTPATGGAASGIMWGNYIDIAELNKYVAGINFRNYDGQTSSYGISNPVYLPSDAFSGVKVNPYDTETIYTATNNYAPSPYNEDGTKNDAYHSLGVFSSVTNNCLKDMDGKGNTFNILRNLNQDYLEQTLYGDTLDNARNKVYFDTSIEPVTKTITAAGETWYDSENTLHTATDEDINTRVQDYTNSRITLNLFPAACACVKYSSILKPCTIDTTKTLEENIAANAMPWYLPACGEVGYSIVRRARIEYAISQVGGATVDKIAMNNPTALINWIWSSSEAGYGNAWQLSHPSSGAGYVSKQFWGGGSKGYPLMVRPFAAF